MKIFKEVNMVTSEKAEQNANRILTLADKIGEIILLIDNMGRENWQAIKDEPNAYEHIVIKGPDLQHALKTIAMRLDRSSLSKLEG